ncbi:MAG: DUF1460 domain-containing protein [Candidatus Kapaibacteriales bacterium]
MDRVYENGWDTLTIGERIGYIGLEFQDVPYVAGTLDREEQEVCNLLFDELDCVTYMELVVNLARSVSIYDTVTADDLTNEIIYTRYRGGELDGYASRLHYTSEWIIDNGEKSVIENITEELGGVEIDFGLNFMSKNTKYYPKLAEEENLEVVEQIEDFINEGPNFYIPKSKVAGIENQLKTGDIIAITSSVKGLDYNHVGFVYVDESGTRRFMHASLGKKKVVLDKRLSEYLNSVEKHTGITVLRPLETDLIAEDEEEEIKIYYEY